MIGGPEARLRVQVALVRDDAARLCSHLQREGRHLSGWHWLSNATCLMRPDLFSAALLVLYG